MRKFPPGFWLYAVPLLLILGTTYASALWQGYTEFTWPKSFGHKTEAMFDLWSFQHLLTGVVIGSLFNLSRRDSVSPLWLAGVLLVIIAWEHFELQFEGLVLTTNNEPILVGLVRMVGLDSVASAFNVWLDGMEHWSNRFIADPALVMSGALIGHRQMANGRRWFLYVLGAVVSMFFILHLFLPNVSSVQDWLF